MPSRKRAARRVSSASSAAAMESLLARLSARPRLPPWRANSGLQGSKPLLKSGKAARELIQAPVALARCSPSGRGPWRREDTGIVILRAVLRRPPGGYQRSQQPCYAFGERGIGGHGGELILPQIDVAAGERGKIGRFRHGGEYT